jgi:anti-sigma regulatory factor (Ser/Thr protein kinase)
MTTVHTTITSAPADLARVPQWIADFAAAQGISGAIVSDLNVALDEVLSNVVKYGYVDDRVHSIWIRLTVSKSAIEAQIEDDGVPFDPLSFPSPDLDVSSAERKVGGLGIHFVRTLMSEVTYSRVAGRNRLVLVKHRVGA